MTWQNKLLVKDYIGLYITPHILAINIIYIHLGMSSTI